MTKYVVVSKPNPHLPHNSHELASAPPPDALNDEVAQRNAELFIRQLMLGEGQEKPEKAVEEEPSSGSAVWAPAQPAERPAVADPVQPVQTEPVQAKPVQAPRPRGADALPPLRPADETEDSRVRSALMLDDEIEDDGETGGWRSNRRLGYGALVLVAIFALIWPVATGAALLLLLWLGILAVMALNRAVADGRWQRFARKHPAMAERMRRAADRLAEKLDVALDCLPGRWADSLALPDLSQPLSGAGRSRRGDGGRRYS